MKVAIIFASQTGNTLQVALAVREIPGRIAMGMIRIPIPTGTTMIFIVGFSGMSMIRNGICMMRRFPKGIKHIIIMRPITITGTESPWKLMTR